MGLSTVWTAGDPSVEYSAFLAHFRTHKQQLTRQVWEHCICHSVGTDSLSLAGMKPGMKGGHADISLMRQDSVRSGKSNLELSMSQVTRDSRC